MAGKVAVVTGGSRGIGAAVCRKLAEQGAGVALVYASNDAAAEAARADCEASGVKALAYRCDVADFEASAATVKQILADFSTVDILVNNAGITKDGLVMRMKEAEWDSVLAVNLKGTFNMIRHLSPVFVKARGGSIVNISSISGLAGNAGQANYSASKAGVIGLTKAVARELAARGVRCNAVAPGFIETDMTAGLDAASFSQGVPLGRLGSAADVAEAVAFLAGPAAAYITGEVIRVDGGLAI